MTTEEIHDFHVNSGGIEILKASASLHSVISSNEDGSPESKGRQRLRGAALGELENLTKCKRLSLHY